MSRTIRFGGAAVLSILAPAAAAAQGLSIGHEPARCIVAGRPSTLRACFVPAAELAAARVYFRKQSRESWSQVEMRVEAACHAGVLPALGRDVVGKKVLYAIEAVDRASTSHRTAEFAPVVVARAGDCGGRGGVAPMAGRGVSTAVVIGGVAAWPGPSSRPAEVRPRRRHPPPPHRPRCLP